MGQFYSREFDGDPYIDLMRSLPERELVWWAQKVIWLAEGFTFVDHFTRTYPRLFQHKCPRCKGAGVLTCPACAGTKIPLSLPNCPATQQHPAGPHSHLPHHHSQPLPLQPPLLGASSSSSSPPAAAASGGTADLLSSPFRARYGPAADAAANAAAASPDGAVGGGSEECRVCGQACRWDAENDWMERWNDWESKMAYYDKATGPLMDEWYEDVLNAGNLEEDTPPMEDDPPGPEVKGRWPDDDRLVSKDRKRFTALMKRFGHPYDTDASLGYQIVDPTATMGENVWNMAQVYNSLPPELNPLRLEGLEGRGTGAGAAGGGQDAVASNMDAIDVFDAEIEAEAAIMDNLEAAVRDLPKPHRFKHTAGTIPCTDCGGAAWSYSFFPNTQRLFGIERPFWTDTIARLGKYWNPTTLSDPRRTGHLLPYGEHGLRSLLAAAEGEDPLQQLTGRAPESTGRYRRELELLVGHPELRDGRLGLKPGRDALEAYLGEEDEAQRGEGGSGNTIRDLAAAAVPLQLPAAGDRKARRQQKQDGALALSRG